MALDIIVNTYILIDKLISGDPASKKVKGALNEWEAAAYNPSKSGNARKFDTFNWWFDKNNDVILQTPFLSDSDYQRILSDAREQIKELQQQKQQLDLELNFLPGTVNHNREHRLIEQTNFFILNAALFMDSIEKGSYKSSVNLLEFIEEYEKQGAKLVDFSDEDSINDLNLKYTCLILAVCGTEFIHPHLQNPKERIDENGIKTVLIPDRVSELVQEFQKNNNLVVDGQMGETTRSILLDTFALQKEILNIYWIRQDFLSKLLKEAPFKLDETLSSLIHKIKSETPFAVRIDLKNDLSMSAHDLLNRLVLGLQTTDGILKEETRTQLINKFPDSKKENGMVLNLSDWQVLVQNSPELKVETKVTNTTTNQSSPHQMQETSRYLTE